MPLQTSNPDRTIPTRRVDLDETFADLPKYFAADGDLLLSHFAAALSSVFPDGEEYFVRSVRAFRDQITDPVLKRQVAGFIGQESIHGREHRAFNARLAALGYPTKHVERITDKILRTRERLMSERRTWPPPRPSSTTRPRSPRPCSRTRRSSRSSATTAPATCSSGTPSRSPSTRPSPSTSTAPSAAPSACAGSP
jgi:hypothetical protein